MRGIDCQCGEYLTAENDERLQQAMRKHVDEAHPDQEYPDSRLKSMIDESAYDVQENVGV
jgi:hypothetical protein